MPSANVLASSQEAWITDQAVETYFDSTVTLNKLVNSMVRHRVDGGESISATIQTKGFDDSGLTDADPLQGALGATNTIAVAEGQKYKVINTQFLQKANWPWRKLGLSVQVNEEEFDVYNKGEPRVINLAQAYLDNLKESVKQELARNTWQDGDEATLGAANQITSLRAALLGTANYGGLTPAQHNKNLPLTDDLQPNWATVSDIQGYITRLRMERNAKPSLVVCGLTQYNSLNAEANSVVRHPDVRPNVTVELGVVTFTISGVPVVYDPFLDSSVADLNGHNIAGSKQVYILDTNEIGFVPKPAGRLTGDRLVVNEFFEMTPWMNLTESLNLPVYQTNISSVLQLVVLNRRKQAVINVGP